MWISDTKLQKLNTKTQSEHKLQQLLKLVQTGWPESKDDVPAPCRNFRDEVSQCDGSRKLIIPKRIHKEMLEIIHASHMGINKCKRRARDVICCIRSHNNILTPSSVSLSEYGKVKKGNEGSLTCISPGF